MRSARAINRELRRVESAIRGNRTEKVDLYQWSHLQGMQQALAWVLGGNAASPTKSNELMKKWRRAKRHPTRGK